MNAVHRIRLIVPSSNTTMETEVPALLRARERDRPEDRFALHSARVRMQHVTPEQLRSMNAHLARSSTASISAWVAPYLKELTRLVAGYIEDAGIEVGDAISLEVADNQAVAALDPEDLKTDWERLDLRDCDALVLSACVQLRSLSVIEEVESRSGLPTLSAATATTWALLRALDLEPTAPGAGALLSAPERVV